MLLRRYRKHVYIKALSQLTTYYPLIIIYYATPHTTNTHSILYDFTYKIPNNILNFWFKNLFASKLFKNSMQIGGILQPMQKLAIISQQLLVADVFCFLYYNMLMSKYRLALVMQYRHSLDCLISSNCYHVGLYMLRQYYTFIYYIINVLYVAPPKLFSSRG